jgi:gliding motility-associated-like protein
VLISLISTQAIIKNKFAAKAGFIFLVITMRLLVVLAFWTMAIKNQQSLKYDKTSQRCYALKRSYALLTTTANMRLQLLLCSFFLAFSVALFAQPANDDCDGLIDLGELPACPDDIFDNVNATASDIGFGNIPACFEGGGVQNDVWFAFTTNDTLIDLTITVEGTDMGSNGAIINPQLAIYRGDCSFNNLADLGICGSAPEGESLVAIDVIGLTPNTTYFIRINDYSATAAPNWGDFQLCIEEYVPAINIGDVPSTTSCTGTLYDSGGPDGDYQNNENLTFTIQPAEFFGCLEINMVDFQIENGFDNLNFYAGTTTAGPLIASLTGFGNGEPFVIQSTGPITVEFDSDGSAVQAGFELTWQCSGLACDGSTIDNPTIISGLPFDDDGFSTCDAAATFATSPCGFLPFLNGPEVVFAYETGGGFCADVNVTGAEDGTGVIILDGLPDDPNTTCIGQSESGMAFGVDFASAGTYYIIVANAQGCTDFGLSIEEADCNLNPSLLGALCNPLNGCIDVDGLPSVFNFNQGFQDITYTQGVNSGCWLGVGAAQPNFYWFTIEAQASGPFGFTVQAANPAEASDIDFNVWGPFNTEEVCENPDDVVEFIENNQPIRSSWAGGADPTGLAEIHPILNIPVTDPFDCGDINTPGAGGDDFVSVIDCQPGEIYVALINDWGNNIESGAIQVDWSASADSVLAPIPPIVATADTAICQGESVQILVESSVDNITWLKDTASLSCLDCLDPLATPLETTVYVGVVDAVCYQDTVEILVEVYDIDAGPDQTVCINEEIQIVAGSNFLNAAYTWTAPAGVSLSCTDCPDPFLTAEASGNYEITVGLLGAGCTLLDTMILNVLPQDAAAYNIAPDQQICIGETVNIGGAEIAGVSYEWASDPDGFMSNEANPQVSPDTTTIYYISASNGLCPVPSQDSVLVEVFLPPLISISGDTAICQEEPIVLGNTMVEGDVEYMWTGPSLIEDPEDPNSIAFPENGGTYTLTATRGACVETASFEVTITPIAVDILAEDTLRICRGEELTLSSDVVPDTTALWTSTDPDFEAVSEFDITVTPQTLTTYYAQVGVPGCFKVDSVVVVVDSLPGDLGIMPMDTSVCEGELVLLTSQIFEPSSFPDIEFEWGPSIGFQTPDSLYNMVLMAGQDTITYARIAVNGVCADTSLATINVKPTPLVSIMPMDTVICVGESVQIIAEVSDNVDELEWISGAESLSCDDCLTPLATPAVTTTYTLKAENEDCPVEQSITVTVAQLPAYALNTQTTVCLGQSIVLNTVVDPTATYIWTSTDPNFGTVVDPQPEVSPTENSTYFLAVTNGACDTLFDQISIEVIQTPQLFVSSDALTICQGEEVTLTAEVVNGLDGDIIQWSDGENQIGANEAVVTVSPDATTVYIASLTSESNCFEEPLTETIEIEVVPAPVVAVAMDTIICLGESVQLNTASDDLTTYTWTSDDPNFTDLNNPQPVVTPAQTSTYTLIASNGLCDDVEETVTVEVVGPVELSITGPIGFICTGDEVALVAETTSNTSGDTIFIWEGSDGTMFSGDSIIVSPTTTTTYTLTHITAAGCETLTDTYEVGVEEGIMVDSIQYDPEATSIFLGDELTLTAFYTTNITENLNFSWFEDTLLLQSGIDLETIQVLMDQETEAVPFTVLIETPVGCSASLTDTVLVQRPVVDVPNVFTPNNDGVNDFFNVVVTEDRIATLDVVSFRVYNRWGQLIYDNEDPIQGWDGTFNGEPQPTEAYFYQIEVLYPNGQVAGQFQGNVTLLR